MPFARGRIVCTLEGGYVRSVLGKCCEAVILSLLEGASDNEGSCSKSIGMCGAGATTDDDGSIDDDEEKKVDSDGTKEEGAYRLASPTAMDQATANKCNSISPSADKSIRCTIASHASYWKCFTEASD